MARMIQSTVCILLGATTLAIAQQSLPVTHDEVFQQVQKQFAEAYNRKDVEAMAELFTENGLRDSERHLQRAGCDPSQYARSN